MLELQTFGGLELRTRRGAPVDALAGRTKCLALLAYLAAEAPDRVPRERAAALLWPGGTDDQARNSLRVALSLIRGATDATLVHGKGASRLALAGDQVRADVAEFREAVEAGDETLALELYQGDFLAGVRVPDADRFQRWADERRGSFRRAAYEAALSLGTAAREAGDLIEAEARFRTALDLAPLREAAAAKLIRTLAERGHTADAVQLYESFRTRREEELELAPSEELERRVEELRASPPAAPGSEEVRPAGDRGAGEAGPAEPEPAPAAEGGGPTGGEPRGGEGPGGADADRPSPIPPRPQALAGALVMLGVLAAAVVGVWYLLGSGGKAAPAVGDRSIAVLPFEAVGEGGASAVARGMHADLLTRLANVGDLEVTARTSVERYRDRETTTPDIARQLGVRWVVEGTVQQAGDELQVSAQLIDPRTDTHAWARSYRRELTADGLFNLQADITRRVAGTLEAHLTRSEAERLARQSTGSLAAHRFYIRGRSLMEQRRPEELHRALDYFHQALAEDSSYALAWAGIANTFGHLARRTARGDTLIPKAREAAQRALRLDPELAEAHAARGRLHMYREEGPAALRDLRRAVELKPSYAAGHTWMAKLLLSLGRPEEALEHARRGVELGPLSHENLGTLCWALLANDRPERALEVVRRIEELESDRGGASYRMLTLAHMGRLEELRRLFRETQIPEDQAPWVVALEARRGNPAPAERRLAEATDSTPVLVRAALHSALGQPGEAVEALREAYPREEITWDYPLSVYVRYFFPSTFGPLRAHPGFEAYLREVNTHWGLNPDGSLPEG